VLLVTLPEEMPVTEVVETAYQLEDRVGVTLGPVIVNACLPEEPLLNTDPTEAAEQAGVDIDNALASAIGRAAGFHTNRYGLQAEQLERLARELPLPQLHAPFLFGSCIGPKELESIGARLAREVGRLQDEHGK
jgi:hypothetical protein